MPKPYKDPEIQQRIKNWVEQHPDRVYTATYKDIQVEADVSLASLYRYFPLIVARVVDVLPSVVIEKRLAKGGMSPRRARLSDKDIAEIQRLFTEGNTALDIAFITGHSLSKVEQYRPQKGGE